MAQNRDIRTFSKGMNKDIDPRLLPDGYYIDGLNINIRDNLNGVAGSVTNFMESNGIAGNDYYDIADTQTILGIFSDETENELYIFIHDSRVNPMHRIVKYSLDSDTSSVVVVSEDLPFTSSTLIKSCDIVDGVIYWTDGTNEPMMFDQNLDYLALAGLSEYNPATTYNTGNVVYYQNIPYIYINVSSGFGNAPSGSFTATDYWSVEYQNSFTEDIFTVAKVVPRNKPIVNIHTDETHKGNNILGKFLQFKYRFIFKNNQKSSFSAVSKVAYSEDDYITPGQNAVFNNAINIKIDSSGANYLVDKVEIVAREGNNGIWRSVATLDAANLIADGEILNDFYNNGLYSAVETNEGSQIYSDVPKTADAQVFSNNRLIYGNCKTGYDKDVQLSFTVELLHGSEILTTGLVYNTNGVYGAGIARNLNPVLTEAGLADFFNDISYVPKYGDVIRFQGDYASDANRAFGDLSVRVDSGMGISEIFDEVYNAQFYIAYRNATWNDSVTVSQYYGELQTIYQNDHLTISITESGSGHQATLKSGSWYDFGYQYYDQYGRTNGAIVDTSLKFYVPSIGERYIIEDPLDDPTYRIVLPEDTRGVGATTAMIIFDHTPPAWATHYSIIYSRTKTSSLSETLVISSASKGTLNETTITLASYNDFQTRFPNTAFSYDFVKGDRIRFITRGHGDAPAYNGATTYYPGDDVTSGGFYYVCREITTGVAPTGAATDNDQWRNVSAGAELDTWVTDIYDYEITSIDTTSNLTIKAYIPDDDLTATEMADALIEIYRPGREIEEDESIFYESTKIYPITNGGHGGTVAQDVTGTGGVSTSLFGLNFTSVGKFEYTYMRLAGSSGVPKSSLKDGSTGVISISSIVFDQDLYSIWDSGTSFTSGDRCQYNGGIYTWGGVLGTTGEPGVDVDWTLEAQVSGNTISISNVKIIEGDYFYMLSSFNGFALNAISADWYGTTEYLPVESCSCTYTTNQKGIIMFDDGDAYYRIRNLKTGVTPYNRNIESFSISDFRDSQHANIGRPTAIINQKEEQRYATLMYSEFYIPNTEINNLNNFYPDVNYEEYNRNFGNIVLLQDDGDRLLMYQEDKISMVLVDRAVTYNAQGQANLLGTQAVVLSTAIPLDGEFGIADYRSVVSAGNRAYFIDVQRGVVGRIVNQQIEEVSKLGMVGWFSDELRQVRNGTNKEVVGMYDPANQLVIFYLEEQSEGIIFSELDNAWISRTTVHTPQFSAYLNNRSFFVRADMIYEINQTGVRNSLDSTANGGSVITNISSIKFPSNAEAGSLKNYLALEIDANFATKVKVETTGMEQYLGQVTNMIEADHVLREHMFHCPIYRDENTPLVSNPVFEGESMKGKHAVITMETDVNKDVDWLLRDVQVIISKG